MNDMNICLLGGSNSVMKMGFSHGLLEKSDTRLALGASSSIQNIHSIVKNNKIIKECNVIVTESNVNDFHNIAVFKFDEKTVTRNIKFLYDELYRTGRMIVSLILPVRISLKNKKSVDLKERINKLHRSLSKKYGFYLIDVDDNFSPLYTNESLIKIIMSDTRHPLDSFMYMLGANLRSYLLAIQEYPATKPIESNFITIDDEILSNGMVKNNSMFHRDVKKISSPIKISCKEFSLCGIETWSNGASQIRITNLNNNNYIIKQFSDSLQFNEIFKDQLSTFYVESILGEPEEVTEPCIDKTNIKFINDETILTSTLFIKNNATLIAISTEKMKGEDISFLIPDNLPHISSVNKSLSNLKMRMITKTSQDQAVVNSLRDSAIALENIDLELSLQLMSLAHEMRPNGPFIKNKLNNYKAILNKFKTQTN